ncbi:hypothetical protein AVEN_210673-1 [Araneus ventricosus]|uniref:Uncharacterized protein n=1 Tax=Araneus ventricosus TaxID=182803 RepID=A0A4Y2X0R4_ARAVE|nr:hypothetical protein AVEN_210673-1 [Araneus ventricosus]
MRRRREEPACDRHMSARLRQLGNVVKPGAFSDVGTDGSRWETAPLPRSPSCADEYTATAAAAQLRADIAPSDYHLLQQLIWFLVGQHFPTTTTCRHMLSSRQAPLRRLPFIPVYRNWSHGMTVLQFRWFYKEVAERVLYLFNKHFQVVMFCVSRPSGTLLFG